ncbi:unnamed protein product, partial [Mesorhabditis belari]|uniref:Neurotransmitter-gated ion-channel ligand-binding domain-containing protein n=1 Tax=Mesorhabditis belari TaxID=2138241 RepID=A0AAF3J6R6_9BILA
MLLLLLLFLLFGYSTSFTADDQEVKMMKIFGSGAQLAGGGKNQFEVVDRESVYQQGQQGQFLQFLRRIAYDRGQHPENPNGEAVTVNISVLISNIRSVSEINMDYSLEIFFRESWKDPRLQFGVDDFNKTMISLHESYADFLWRPDTFVPNAINSKTPRDDSFTHRSLYRLKDDGTVITSRRISLVAECSLDLTRYPFDKQLCKLGLESYGYTADQITYSWAVDKNPLEMYPIRLPDFEIEKAYATKRVVDYSTGSYTRLYACFVFSRSAGYCYLQLIVPSVAIVVTAWLSLWRESESSFEDMITILMSIIFLLYSYNSVMPRVSYIKAMDIYLGVCFSIAFLSLIKLSIMTFMRLQILGAQSSSGDYIQVHKDANGQDEVPIRKKWIFSEKCMHIFHVLTQVLLFMFFTGFCTFFFLIYPRLPYHITDPDCDPQIAVANAVKI